MSRITGTRRSRPTSCGRSIKLGTGDAVLRAARRRGTRRAAARVPQPRLRLRRRSTSCSRPSQDRTRVDLDVRSSRRARRRIVDHILIVGNVAHRSPRSSCASCSSSPASRSASQDQFESRRRLSALGLFRRVQITELTHGSGNEHDVLVTVEEAPATTIGYGGGLEGVHDAAHDRSGRAGRGAARVRAARLLRHRAAQPVRRQPVGQPVHARQPAAQGRSPTIPKRTAPASASASTASSAPIGSRDGSGPTT